MDLRSECMTFLSMSIASISKEDAVRIYDIAVIGPTLRTRCHTYKQRLGYQQQHHHPEQTQCCQLVCAAVLPHRRLAAVCLVSYSCKMYDTLLLISTFHFFVIIFRYSSAFCAALACASFELLPDP